MIDPLSIKPTEQSTWLRSLTRALRELYTYTDGDVAPRLANGVASLRFIEDIDVLNGDAMVTFDSTSAFGQGYRTHIFRFRQMRVGTDGAVPFLRVNGAGGGSDYQWVNWAVAVGGAGSANSDNADSEMELNGAVGNAAGEGFNLDVVVCSPDDTSMNHHIYWVFTRQNTSGTPIWAPGFGVYQATTAITSIDLDLDSGNFAGGYAEHYVEVNT